MALTDAQKTDVDAPYIDGELIPVPAAAGELIPAGTIVCINADGLAVGGQLAPDLVYAGRAEERADNTGGGDGDIPVLVRRHKAFRWANDGTVTQAALGKRIFILDNRTLTDAAGIDKTTHSPSGVVVMLGSDGVWIE
ncbi:hypothetical protein [Enterobacter sp. PTB]|uniref:hypothetical protein n=1 Tax=Enterobacter sp. PTB TaxID=3143437 RepID=UPI003DA9C2BF